MKILETNENTGSDFVDKNLNTNKNEASVGKKLDTADTSMQNEKNNKNTEDLTKDLNDIMNGTHFVNTNISRNTHTEDIDGVSTSSNPDAESDGSVCSVSDSRTLLEENKRLTDELLRTRAEMENSRKRLKKFFEEKVQEKNKALLLDIIDLLDNFERALTVGDSNNDDVDKPVNKLNTNQDAIVEGIKLIETQFLKTLETNWKLSRYDSHNAVFDPILHEALMREDSDKVTTETVIEEFMKGYMYDQKVLRPAKVKVAIPK